jgi:hypothetical protein
MEGVQLPNGEYVGVAVTFKMPDLFDGVTTRDAMKVQRIVGQALEDGEPYRQSVQAKMWVGLAVAEALDLDVEKKHEKAKIRAIVKQWLETDVLRLEQFYAKRQAREVQVVSVGTWITGEEAGL